MTQGGGCRHCKNLCGKQDQATGPPSHHLSCKFLLRLLIAAGYFSWREALISWCQICVRRPAVTKNLRWGKVPKLQLSALSSHSSSFMAWLPSSRASSSHLQAIELLITIAADKNVPSDLRLPTNFFIYCKIRQHVHLRLCELWLRLLSRLRLTFVNRVEGEVTSRTSVDNYYRCYRRIRATGLIKPSLWRFFTSDRLTSKH